MPDSSPSPSRDFQIYLSSTLDDLVDEREAAIEILRKHGRVIDSYRAGPRPTVENCLADVRSSQLYVLIQGRRYGWVPAGESDTHAKSITEMEYDECTVNADSPIPRLVFMRTTTPDRFNDDIAHPRTAERMRRFRERATTEQQPYNFDTVGEFSVALTEPVMTARAAWERAATLAIHRDAILRQLLRCRSDFRNRRHTISCPMQTPAPRSKVRKCYSIASTQASSPTPIWLRA